MTIHEGEVPHNYNKPILRTVYRYIMIQQGNILIGVTGRVRHGKSHTAIHILKGWNRKLHIKDCLVYTVTELMKRTLTCILIDDKPLSEETYMGFKSTDEMNLWLNQMQTEGRMRIKPGRVIVFDEAGAGVFVRTFFSQDNITISKVVQLWGMLRMLIVVVVPEHMGVAEKNLRQFMDVEIRMQHVYRTYGYATCIAYEYFDKSDPDNPKKRRISGCKYGGKIKITELSPEDAAEYDRISAVMKVSALLELARGKHGKKAEERDSKKSDDLDILEKELLAGELTFKRPNKRGVGDIWDFDLMHAVLKKPLAKLRAAAAKIDYKRESGIDPS
ncbi:MAG: hypothetical protein FJY76_04030 [Candidatus Aenigmarchaeota archaeon]|nr:hypothetical protein [Candidatus Aenigmarchaeota archaeon]